MRTPLLFLVAALVAVPLAAGATQHGVASTVAATDAPTLVTSTTATLNGHVSLSCSGSRGFKLGSQNLPTGTGTSGNQSISRLVTGLTPGTAYSYYAYGLDCSSVYSAGEPTVFTTLARITLSISGSGKVTGGISCTSSCSADVTNAARASFVATPAAGYKFASWGGLCAGQPATCSAIPTGSDSLSVTFTAVHTLTVTRAGDGSGTVASGGGEIACGSTCSASFASGASVTLTATPAEGSVFTGWSGGCSGASAACVVSLGSDQAVTATFGRERKLSVGLHGRGTVTSAPAGILCTDACSALFAPGTAVTLTAKAQEGWRFTGWDAPCSGTGPCAVTLAADTTVSAEFRPLFELRVLGVGGHGIVRSAPNGILCGKACSKAFLQGAVVTLRATPAAGYRFAGWAGDCRGAKTTCIVTMRHARAVVAQYAKR